MEEKNLHFTVIYGSNPKNLIHLQKIRKEASSSSFSLQKYHHQLICYYEKVVTFVFQRPRSKYRLFDTYINSINGGCIDKHGVSSQDMFLGMMRRINSLVFENLDMTQKLKYAKHEEKNATERNR